MAADDLNENEPEVHARRMTPVADAGIRWWGHFFNARGSQIAQRMQSAGTIYWTLSERMPIDLFSYFREAGLCFSVARYLAAITLSSCAVELILNRDRRTRKHHEFRRIGGWVTLNNQNLIVAGRLGLPVLSLCSDGESLETNSPLAFIERRNKVAHGEVLPMLSTLSDYDAKAEQEALDQILKGQRFIIEWFNTAPDVQEGLIVNHQWPDPGQS
jgi:hypothetical protein